MRALAFAFVVLGLQSALPVLLAGRVQPDLFMLAALALAARMRPTWGLVLGYGLGLLQDVLGHGMLGFHAAGVAAGVYAGYAVRRLLSTETVLNHALAVAVALAAKWLAFLALAYWTRLPLVTTGTWGTVALPELVATLLVGPLVYALADWAFGPVPNSEERLL